MLKDPVVVSIVDIQNMCRTSIGIRYSQQMEIIKRLKSQTYITWKSNVSWAFSALLADWSWWFGRWPASLGILDDSAGRFHVIFNHKTKFTDILQYCPSRNVNFLISQCILTVGFLFPTLINLYLKRSFPVWRSSCQNPTVPIIWHLSLCLGDVTGQEGETGSSALVLHFCKLLFQEYEIYICLANCFKRIFMEFEWIFQLHCWIFPAVIFLTRWS